MPTRDVDPSFLQDFRRLTREQRQAFLASLQHFIQDVDRGEFRASLRVKPMRGYAGVWEMTWEGNDGRATFSYGAEQIVGKRHVIWRRIGTHAIFDNP